MIHVLERLDDRVRSLNYARLVLPQQCTMQKEVKRVVRRAEEINNYRHPLTL